MVLAIPPKWEVTAVADRSIDSSIGTRAGIYVFSQSEKIVAFLDTVRVNRMGLRSRDTIFRRIPIGDEVPRAPAPVDTSVAMGPACPQYFAVPRRQLLDDARIRPAINSRFQVTFEDPLRHTLHSKAFDCIRFESCGAAIDGIGSAARHRTRFKPAHRRRSGHIPIFSQIFVRKLGLDRQAHTSACAVAAQSLRAHVTLSTFEDLFNLSVNSVVPIVNWGNQRERDDPIEPYEYVKLHLTL
ncbi:hypothetical protein AXG93_4346s1220 [Marchantia polymorpha subsp. ruderalis]|uniref:Uncharacterized protein n=1 Tax=Marchantia polymorpha subsp. ruderalis TaxID=1480154 RepID=A0A176WU90_MARPO|nr:hypothetical protein AXG93_4346s1220 [Marchantia polymorpha subsp. ruderalis]